MEKFIVNGGKQLSGKFVLSGAKNVALKACIASLLTKDKIILKNIPHIWDVKLMLEVLNSLGVKGHLHDHVLELVNNQTGQTCVPLEIGARFRTSSMVIGPLLALKGKAQIPNPGGCRIGARPIDRHIEALKSMGAEIRYDSKDGFFYASATGLKGATIKFPKNSHTGTETIILSAVLACGVTIIENAAEEVEVDDLINILNQMGADIKRIEPRIIRINGVDHLHGAEYSIMPDRNEEATVAVLAAASKGSVIVSGSKMSNIKAFLEEYEKAGAGYEVIDENTVRYFYKGKINPVNITTSPHPGFMTDWQAPWAVLMSQADGISVIHETVFESRFSYVEELRKMGARIETFRPEVKNPEKVYNFNTDNKESNHQAIKIWGPTKMHNAVLEMHDLRAGATVLIAALIASGISVLYGVEQIDRGYESITEKLIGIGADIKRIKED